MVRRRGLARYIALARRLTPRGATAAHEATDVVHDTYARLLSSEGWRFIEDPKAYVLTMIRNLAIERLRRARVVSMEALSDFEGHRHASAEPDSFEIASGRQRLRIVLAAMRRLPPACREVVELRRLHDVPTREIAKRLGLSLSTVEKRLARGMVLLTQAMSQVALDGPAVEVSETARGRKKHAS